MECKITDEIVENPWEDETPKCDLEDIDYSSTGYRITESQMSDLEFAASRLEIMAKENIFEVSVRSGNVSSVLRSVVREIKGNPHG